MEGQLTCHEIAPDSPECAYRMTFKECERRTGSGQLNQPTWRLSSRSLYLNRGRDIQGFSRWWSPPLTADSID